ncbi:coiled-coil domain-containing protein 137-like [Littorina saxatilis]|uniref:Coiled-coil domain-containing protein 137 n=1 Tax=Littorina saxatilis TaxID=31220 RepID=A0AAN9BUX4_9CAEN
MGKLQKSNKHKKLKFVDPFYHGERKERMHAGRNLDPKYTEQGISRSVKDLMRRTELAKEMKNMSRRKKKEVMDRRMLAENSTEGAERTMTEIPKFLQKKGETQHAFMRRVDATTLMTIKESQIEAGLKREADPLTDEKEEKSSKKKERLKLKKEAKKQKEKEKKEDRKDDFHQFKDKVEFGEVVHGPPSLSVRPKHAVKQDKPAVKSLLLYDIMKKNTSQNSDQGDKPPPKAKMAKSPKAVGKGTKRKLLSPLQQAKMDRERQDAIDLYRQMKKKTNASSLE